MAREPKAEGEMIALLIRAIEREGSLRAAAKRFKVSAAYLSDVMGARRAVGPKLAKALGYRVKVVRLTRREYFRPTPEATDARR